MPVLELFLILPAYLISACFVILLAGVLTFLVTLPSLLWELVKN